MKQKNKVALSVLVAVSGLLMGGSAGAVTLPGWAGMADPFSEAYCWREGYGRLYYNSEACGSDTVNDDFAVPIPIKKSIGGDTVTIEWETGTDCNTCIGTFQAKVLVFKSDGSLQSASSWVTTLGPHSVNVSVPVNGTVQLWVQAGGALVSEKFLSRVSTSGTLSI